MASNPQSGHLEIWGGIEPTIVRVGDTWRNQIQETGHDRRPEDLDRIAALGIRTLRYPVLWESIAPREPEEMSWSWHDARLRRLRALGMDVVAGLVHHGSGPHYTNLLDPAFPQKLARYAASVAERYPWLEKFTPVNEPLTTARFSALYGHWFPHRADYASCLRALIIQCRGIVLSMRAIQRITPSAKLVQTEDLGRTFSTPLLRYQSDFANEQRWLTNDFLCGRINHDHPLYGFLLQNGMNEEDVRFFQDHARPPDILGMNHYLTSDRHLDERLDLYPSFHHGGNGRHRYADVEAVRVEMPPGTLGPAARLREMWERYHIPVAVTEVHHGSTRDEQLRWLMESWRSVRDLREEGVDVRGFTVWALFGLYDWRSLMLRRDKFYEPGAFDVRSEPPQPTVLAAATAAMVRGEAYQHPALQAPGWWRRSGRHYVAPAPDAAQSEPGRQQPLLITGGAGKLCRVLARFCAARGLRAVAAPDAGLDMADFAAVQEALTRHRPWAVIDGTGQGPGDDVFQDGYDDLDGHVALARCCAELGVPLVSFSTAEVFDGQLQRPYLEGDAVSPASLFGEYKAEVEQRVTSIHPEALIVRLGHLVEAEAAPPPCLAPAALTHLPDLAHAVLDLLVDGRTGIWHLTHPEEEPVADPGVIRLSSAKGQVMPWAGDWLRRLAEAEGATPR
ncbi:sugar nucleotide-binding protein [Roseomonas sp. ACRSG]|nr:sugar nucleotide-binding protein [Roseomonas sp. ACRSG]